MMKKIIFPILFMLSNFLGAQVMIGGVNINAQALQYIEVWDKPVKSLDKSYGLVDYGQKSKLSEENTNSNSWTISNRKGGALQFNGIIEVLNYMYRNGWEVLHSKETDGFNSYILKRRKGVSMAHDAISQK